ncbi:ATP-binding protein [Streptomyces sp. B93]|uniref:ATP-binding protein n=1 Tax=Streptomyces sp. B93 TaxID=2824875 RepID=UPI001B399CFF|nr:ATP-binding protein [Streptomyces sp. B93]MBQ1093991.1 ATP-binding protein [Streptomyces sp. B93]
MKQSAAKSLGVAALGAAFAAAGAGAANAAPDLAGVSNQALDTVTRTLPAENVERAVPGSSQALAQGQRVLGTGITAAQPAVQQLLAEGPTGPAAALLGGLPTQGLPVKGTPVNGLPLGG